MKFRVKIMLRAERDLKDIWLIIAEHNLDNADRFLLQLDLRIGSLVEFPDRGADRSELGHGVRMLVEGNYLIFYRKISLSVEVLRVVYGGMDLSKLNLNS